MLDIFLALLHHQTFTHAYDPNDCHFAQSYKADDLFASAELQEEFLLRASWWQGAFARDNFGRLGPLTLVGVEMDFNSRLPIKNIFTGYIDQRVDSDAMNEAVHLALLAAALDGDAYAMEFIRSSKHTSGKEDEEQMTTLTDFILHILAEKISLYSNFNRAFPGYGGYLQTFTIDRLTNSIRPSPGKTIYLSSSSVYVWAMVAVAQVLHEKKHKDLAIAFKDYVELMANTGLTIFYRNNVGQSNKPRPIMTVEVEILNETAGVTRSNYQPSQLCIAEPRRCDPVVDRKAELFLLFQFHYGNWAEYGGTRAKNAIFDRIKQGKNPAYFVYKQQKNASSIIVEKREVFDADELIKYLFLPYLDIPICEKLFLNANRVSTIYANINKYPGLFGVAVHAATDALDLNCSIVYPGIPQVSYYIPSKNDVVMPHAAFPLFLHPASWRYGVVWLANMLNSTVSQTSLGAMDTIKMTGDFTSLTLWWFRGPLNVLAFGGGRVSAITRRYLKRTGKYDDFHRLFERQYNSFVFPHDQIFKREISFALPSGFMPNVGTNRQCDPDLHDFDNPDILCITFGAWNRCSYKVDLHRAILSIIALPFIILVLYISIVKHRKEKAVHKYFTLHLFVVHLVTAVIWPAMLITSTLFPSTLQLLILESVFTFTLFNNFVSYRLYIDRYYVTHFFTLIMSLTLFSMASALLLPFFYKRWMAEAKKWHCYVAICHILALFASYPGGLSEFNVDKKVYQKGGYVIYITALFYSFLFCMALAIVYVIIQMKKRARMSDDNKNVAAKQAEIASLISSLLYAIVPTVWCMGGQLSDFLLLMGSFQAEETIVSYNTFEKVSYYFRSSYPLAHSLATLVGLGPYRRSLAKMIGDIFGKKK